VSRGCHRICDSGHEYAAEVDLVARPSKRKVGVEMGGCAGMSEMWDSVAPGWEANAGSVDEQLALATGCCSMRPGSVSTVQAMSTPMHAASLEQWWERVPKLAGPLAIALAGMDADVQNAIRERAIQSGTEAAASERDGAVFEGSVLIGSGYKAAR
jgi:hypothetical protein